MGRLKDVIIRNGENISAKEIEDLLFAHPAVRDVAVIGLPDPRVGERCCAVVALDESKGPFGFEEMVTFLKSHDLMVQKLPEQLEILDSVPRNAAGKVLKEQLRNQFSAASSALGPSGSAHRRESSGLRVEGRSASPAATRRLVMRHPSSRRSTVSRYRTPTTRFSGWSVPATSPFQWYATA